MTDEELSAIIEGFDAGQWIDGEYRLEGSDMMRLAREIQKAAERQTLERAATECIRKWEICGNAWACAVAVCSLEQGAQIRDENIDPAEAYAIRALNESKKENGDENPA